MIRRRSRATVWGLGRFGISAWETWMSTSVSVVRAAAIVFCAATVCLTVGCNRQYYREQADSEVACLIDEKSDDERWDVRDFNIDLDPRSRYANVYDPDRPPMPPDDPASHQLMHHIDGMDHWDGWHDNGNIEDLENPYWKQYLAEYADVTNDGQVRLSLDESVRLALMHSPTWQQQLETLYFSALDVSSERFRYDVQFFGGTGASFTHIGQNLSGGESNQLATVNDAGGGNRTVLNRRFSAAGQLLVDFANTFTWEFFGANGNTASSSLGLTFIQPLLRAGGREFELERLTIAERALLGNLRTLERYRQGFYTNVAIGNLGVSGLQRRGGFQGGTGLTGFTGQGGGGFGGVGDATGFGRSFGSGGAAGGGGDGGAGFAGGGAGTVGGFIGLLQQLQQIRNTEDSLGAQLRTLALLESNLEAGLIDIAQVDQFRQNIETERANLLQSRNALATSLDTFKRSTLGLPPNMPVTLDDSPIRQFQLIDPSLSAVLNAISDYVAEFGELPAEPTDLQFAEVFDRVKGFSSQVSAQLNGIPAELQQLDAAIAPRLEQRTPPERKLYDAVRKRMDDELTELRRRLMLANEQLQVAADKLTDNNREATGDRVIELVAELSNILGEGSLIQARARLEMISVESIDLTPERALAVARANRLDWMNNRASLVDSWRLIEFNANNLKSDLSIRFDGDVSTRGNNPVKFDGQKGSLRASVQFDPPYTRLLERNSFRQQLVEYQQARRQLIQYEDQVMQNMRDLVRGLEQLRVNLEIQRRAVAIAIRRVDQTREALNQPVPPAAPGQLPSAFGPTSAQNLLFALSDLRNTQNALMSVWLNYHATRTQLYRELGIMQINEAGLWVDVPLSEAISNSLGGEELPPSVPEQWFKALDDPEAESAGESGESEAAPLRLPEGQARREHKGRFLTRLFRRTPLQSPDTPEIQQPERSGIEKVQNATNAGRKADLQRTGIRGNRRQAGIARRLPRPLHPRPVTTDAAGRDDAPARNVPAHQNVVPAAATERSVPTTTPRQVKPSGHWRPTNQPRM